MNKEKLNDFFNDLTLVKDENEIISLFEKYNIKHMDRKTYPIIKFKISKEEIIDLKEKGIITNDNFINSTISNNESLSALEKLLYSLAWKNGDLKK